MSELSEASMFLNDLSVLDHAYINNEGVVIGGSFNPCLIVSGEVDPIENVVVDFSTIKKDLKNAIDHDDYGFDHKLWIIEGFSQFDTIEFNNIVYNVDALSDVPEGDWTSTIKIITSACTIEMPRNAVKIIPKRYMTSDLPMTYNTSSAGLYIAYYLNEVFASDGLDIVCNNTESCHVYPGAMSPLGMFRYVHGLKDSTSWGCQNLAHGHLSFIQVKTNSSSVNEVEQLVNIISNDLNNTLFINAENIIKEDDNVICIEYNTENRGLFRASYDNAKHKIVKLETETTVEYLVDYVASAYHELLKDYGVSELFVSEGLSKGAHAFIDVK